MRLPAVVKPFALGSDPPDRLDCFVSIMRSGQNNVWSKDLPLFGLRLILLNFFQWSEISRCDVGILWQRNQGREINPCSSFFLRKKHPFEHRIDRSDPMEFHVGGGTG